MEDLSKDRHCESRRDEAIQDFCYAVILNLFQDDGQLWLDSHAAFDGSR